MKVPSINLGNLIEVGVAVTDLSAATRTFAALLDIHATAPVRAPMFSMDFCMCRLGAVDFELMAPYTGSGVISRFLARKGEGLHHIAFQVPDIEMAMASCRARGLALTSDEPVVLEGLRAAFLHPECLSGILVEFVENLHDWRPIENGRRKDIGRISGFGVAVRDVDAAASDYSRVLGAVVSDRSWNEQLRTHVRFAKVGDVQFELIPSSGLVYPEGSGTGDRRGLRHVCLEVFERKDFNALSGQSKSRWGEHANSAFLTDPSVCHGVAFEVHAA